MFILKEIGVNIFFSTRRKKENGFRIFTKTNDQGNRCFLSNFVKIKLANLH